MGSECEFTTNIKQKAKTMLVNAYCDDDRGLIAESCEAVPLKNVLAEFDRHQKQLQDLFAKFKQEVISDCLDWGDMDWLHQEFLKFEKAVLSEGSSRTKKVQGLEHG